jgi:hypothetical protein
MFHRDTSRHGLSTVHLIAILGFVAAIGFSSRGWAFVAGSPPKDDQKILVAEQLSSTSTEQAQKALDYICRAADLPHGSLPAERLSAESSLRPEDAKSTVDAIQAASKTQTPVCSPEGAAPDSALGLVREVGRRPRGTPTPIPVTPTPGPIKGVIPIAQSGIIRDVLSGVKAHEK